MTWHSGADASPGSAGNELSAPAGTGNHSLELR